MINPQHIVTFVQAASAQRVPLHRWPEAWQNAQASHMAQIRRDIWEAKQQGLIVERDGQLFGNDRLHGQTAQCQFCRLVAAGVTGNFPS